ncbi:MAG: DNA-3-methyladenine glycosylase [Candidatus Micrarchaeia archaeon]
MKMKILSEKFFKENSPTVAKKLLGKLLVRKLRNKRLIAKIVETEAYLGKRDPASRAFGGKITKISKWMYEGPGTVLVYMVHANWLFNVVTGKKGDPQAVLIRAVEPINFKADTSGPGKLSRAMKIDGRHSGLNVCNKNCEINITEGNSKDEEKFKIGRSHRIGVKRDLKRKLRFFIIGNKFVSK